MEERSTDKLARYTLYAAAFALAAFLCWYFRSVLVYIIVAFIVSLIGQPVIRQLRKVKVAGKSAPDGFLAILTITFILAILLLVVTEVIPIVTKIIRDASFLRTPGEDASGFAWLHNLNAWIVSIFPGLDPDFDLIAFLLGELKDIVNVSNVSSVIGSVASVVSSAAVGIFSVVFISFFFIRDDKLFSKIVCALSPDPLEDRMRTALTDIESLLSRYFTGLVIEMAGEALLDFLGLWLIARIGFTYAIGIAFIAGILNIIPYVGPLIGEVIGTLLALVIKYGTGAGLDVNIWIFALIVLAIMLFTQLVDNFIYQPLIYSTSIKASPLEIFIVLLVAGHVGGVVGMLAAIPAYTVIRVIASRFFYHLKPIRRLMPEVSEQYQSQSDS